jgi:pimeloyl-ACP methyl ester carboxylesterase
MLLTLITVLIVDSATVFSVPVAPDEIVRVVSRGEGEVVVFIPGLLGSAYGYRHLVEPLAERGYRTIVVEPLGLGGSSRPRRADYSLTAQAERIRAVLDSLEVPSAVVVAHSLGSSIALRLAYRHPDRVRAFVSIEGGVAETALPPGLARAMKLAPLIKLFAGPTLVRRVLMRELRASSADDAWLEDDVITSYIAEFAEDVGATLDAFQGMAEAIEPETLGEHLCDVRAPVVLLLGDAPHNGAPGDDEVAALTAQLPSLTLERVPDAGHYVHEERPAVVLAALSRLLQRNAEAPATLQNADTPRSYEGMAEHASPHPYGG